MLRQTLIIRFFMSPADVLVKFCKQYFLCSSTKNITRS